MGVYIKGLKIPPSGQFVFVLTSSGMVENVNGLVVGEAVEVKAPHGDLIDRDKVIDKMCVKYTKAERQKKFMYASVEVKQGFCDLLTDATTIIEAEGKDDG